MVCKIYTEYFFLHTCVFCFLRHMIIIKRTFPLLFPVNGTALSCFKTTNRTSKNGNKSEKVSESRVRR